MEITLERRTLWFFALILAALLLLGLASLGKAYTPTDTNGAPRLLSWGDWRRIQMEREFAAERAILRQDAANLATLLNQRPDPVSAQLCAQRIARHVASGKVDALAAARTAIQKAADDTLAWASGTLERDEALISLQAAMELLQ